MKGMQEIANELPLTIPNDPKDKRQLALKELMAIVWQSSNGNESFEDWYQSEFLPNYKDKINLSIDEGLLGALTGATIGPWIMKNVCKTLGISERSPLYDLMTSRLVLTAIGIKS